MLAVFLVRGPADNNFVQSRTGEGSGILSGIYFIINLLIYYKIVHEVHDRETYSKNNESSKRSTKHKHYTKHRL